MMAELLTNEAMSHHTPFFLSYRNSLDTNRLLQIVQCKTKRKLTVLAVHYYLHCPTALGPRTECIPAKNSDKALIQVRRVSEGVGRNSSKSERLWAASKW